MGVVHPVITLVIVHGFGWGSHSTHKPKRLSVSECYLHHHLSLSLSCVSSGPINREMRHLISSLQNHNHQLKGDVQRYKRKLRETQMEINKVFIPMKL